MTIALSSELDFIEKLAVSPGCLGVKDWLRAEHFICTLEGEPESSEVTEGAPASPHVGPVEQFEAV